MTVPKNRKYLWVPRRPEMMPYVLRAIPYNEWWGIDRIRARHIEILRDDPVTCTLSPLNRATVAAYVEHFVGKGEVKRIVTLGGHRKYQRVRKA